MPADNSCVTLPGPWKHRLVRASGAQFHVAMAGTLTEGQPLVVLIHGFPEYWYAWRNQIPALAEAGYAVAAVDVRGAGGSDRTRHTFDTPTLASDIIGVVRSLGASKAILVGTGSGGALAWVAASLAPNLISGVVTISSPHPTDTFKLGLHITFRTWRHYLSAFRPQLAERALTNPSKLKKLLSEVSAPGNTGATEAVEYYSQALQLPNAAKTQIQQLRWTWGMNRKRSGRKLLDQISRPLNIPVMTIRGDLDPLLPTRAWANTSRHVAGGYRHEVIPDAGYLAHEEAPDEVLRLLLEYLER